MRNTSIFFSVVLISIFDDNAHSSTVATQQPVTGQGTILGALQCMAPEQLDWNEADVRADIFAQYDEIPGLSHAPSLWEDCQAYTPFSTNTRNRRLVDAG
jgi:hypothetical protein